MDLGFTICYKSFYLRTGYLSQKHVSCGHHLLFYIEGWRSLFVCVCAVFVFSRTCCLWYTSHAVIIHQSWRYFAFPLTLWRRFLCWRCSTWLICCFDKTLNKNNLWEERFTSSKQEAFERKRTKLYTEDLQEGT